MTFKRYEIKYMLTRRQEEQIKQVMAPYMKEDEHGRSTICSLYLDTSDYLLIRRSMDHPVYKEKLRLRSYGVAKENTTVFLELKKKYDSVVYKRRVSMPLAQAEQFLAEETASKADQPVNTGIVRSNPQIRNEIRYCMQTYHDLHPAVLLSYERDAFYGKNDHEFRVTFDHNYSVARYRPDPVSRNLWNSRPERRPNPDGSKNLRCHASLDGPLSDRKPPVPDILLQIRNRLPHHLRGEKSLEKPGMESGAGAGSRYNRRTISLNDPGFRFSSYIKRNK